MPQGDAPGCVGCSRGMLQGGAPGAGRGSGPLGASHWAGPSLHNESAIMSD